MCVCVLLVGWSMCVVSHRGALPLLRGKVEESIRERQAVLEQLRMAATKGVSQEESPLQQDEERPLITIPSLSVAVSL